MQKDVHRFKEEQIRLAKKIIIKDDYEKADIIAGVDQTFLDKKVFSAVIVWDSKKNKVIEQKYVVQEVKMPYIPGYLSYREGPAIVEVINQLENRPDILLIDGHGIAHPRKIGLASHVGLLLDIPTIGVAKNLLCGKIKDGKIMVDDNIRGSELITKEHANPIYVSPGYRICLKSSLEIVKSCIKLPHKYPEPLHLAHIYAKKIMKE